MHIFLFHRDLRLNDNTTLIHQIKTVGNVVPIFIFPPEQINPSKNNYFSNNAVQFMIESLHELYDVIKEYNGMMYFFKGDNMTVLKAINRIIPIKSIGFNIDYTPYAVKRDNMIKLWCDGHNIPCYMMEDYALYDIIGGQTKKVNNTPYLKFTPFRNYCMKNLKVREVDKFKLFKFDKNTKLNKLKYNINKSDINDFYELNNHINVRGGRINGLEILKNINTFKDYTQKRDLMNYNTTFLGAYNHFSTISIREVYHTIYDILGKKSGLINELHWRDFYYNICWYFPHILQGQISNMNISFKKEYENIVWSYNKKLFEKWCNGETGFPLIDSCMKQLNTVGFMHNRGRMVCASFLTKDLHIDWRWGEQYFATKLVDYDPISNSQGWMWCCGNGTDSQPWFRIFNPWTQSIKYDKDCIYIKKWLPELNSVPNKDIHNWYKPSIHNKWLDNNIKYYIPIIEHDEERLKTITLYKKGLNINN